MYGNGFKSGSMRIGKDVIIFTRNDSHYSLGLLSQTFLEEIKSDDVLVPMLTIEQLEDLDNVIPT